MIVMNLFGQPNCFMMFHKPSLLTVSKAFVISMKVTKRSLCCPWHIYPGVGVQQISYLLFRVMHESHTDFQGGDLLKIPKEAVE